MSYFHCPVCRRTKVLDALVCRRCWDNVPLDTREAYQVGLGSAGAYYAKHLELGRTIVADLTEARKAGKPVGYELDVEYGMPPRVEKFHWRGTEAACRRKAVFKSHFRRVVAVRAFTAPQWIVAFGNPAIRESFGRS